jgi:hypothetical protein
MPSGSASTASSPALDDELDQRQKSSKAESFSLSSARM